LKYLETSAKSNINVEEAFFALARYVASSTSVWLSLTEDVDLPYSDIKERLIDSAPGGAAGIGAKAGGAGGNSMSLGQGQSGETKSGCC